MNFSSAVTHFSSCNSCQTVDSRDWSVRCPHWSGSSLRQRACPCKCSWEGSVVSGLGWPCGDWEPQRQEISERGDRRVQNIQQSPEKKRDRRVDEKMQIPEELVTCFCFTVKFILSLHICTPAVSVRNAPEKNLKNMCLSIDSMRWPLLQPGGNTRVALLARYVQWKGDLHLEYHSTSFTGN